MKFYAAVIAVCFAFVITQFSRDRAATERTRLECEAVVRRAVIEAESRMVLLQSQLSCLIPEDAPRRDRGI